VIVSWILIIVAVKRISDETHDGSIFTNALIAVVLAIIGTIIIAVVVAAALFSLIGLGALTSSGSTVPPTDIVSAILGVLAGLAVAWIVGIIGSFFLWRSFKEAGVKTRVGLFGTAG
jgi:uncharacterized membrane protein